MTSRARAKSATSNYAVIAMLGVLATGCAKKAPEPEATSEASPGDKNCCMGKNSCKGKGGCAVVGKNSCAGKNECKGKGGCNMHCKK